MNINLLFGLIGGAFAGGVIGWLARLIKDQVKISKLEKEVSDLKLIKKNLEEHFQSVTQKLKNTENLLSNALSAIEVLQYYKAIDEKTRKKIEKLKATLDEEENPTDETIETYKKLLEEINKKNKAYNEGRFEETERGRS